jgi:hypothetical protein
MRDECEQLQDIQDAISLSALCDTLALSLMPLGVEHRTATLCIVARTFDAVRRFLKPSFFR